MSIKKQYILIALSLLFVIPQVEAQLFNRQKKGGLLKENKSPNFSKINFHEFVQILPIQM